MDYADRARDLALRVPSVKDANCNEWLAEVQALARFALEDQAVRGNRQALTAAAQFGGRRAGHGFSTDVDYVTPLLTFADALKPKAEEPSEPKADKRAKK